MNIYSNFTDREDDLSQSYKIKQSFFKNNWVTKSQWSFFKSELDPFESELVTFEIEKDFINKKSRLSVGKVSPRQTFTLAQNETVLGIKLGDNPQLDENKYHAYNWKKLVVLSEPSVIKIMINNAVYKKYTLEPGKYEFQNFPAYSDRSEIKIIQEATKTTVLHQFDTIRHAYLLQPKKIEYDVVVGKQDSLWSQHANDEIVAAVYSRLGVTPFLSLGAYGQLNTINQGGLFGFWGAPLGLFKTEWSVNQTDHEYWAIRGDYLSYELPDYLWFNNVQGTAQYTGSSFNLEEDDENQQIYKYSSRLTGYFELPFDIFGNINTYYQWDQSNRWASRGIAINFDKKMGDFWLKLIWDQEEKIEEGLSWIVSGKVSYSFPDRKSRLTVQNQFSEDPATLTEYRYRNNDKEYVFRAHNSIGENPEYDISYKSNQWISNLNLEPDQEQNGVELGTKYKGNRGLVAASYHQSTSGDISKRYQFESAIVFTPHAWAFSRPVQNNFVILSPHEAIKGKTVQFSKGEIDKFGPAVITDLPVYKESQIVFKEGDIDLSVDVGRKSFYIYQVNSHNTSCLSYLSL